MFRYNGNTGMFSLCEEGRSGISVCFQNLREKDICSALHFQNLREKDIWQCAPFPKSKGKGNPQ